MGIFSTIVLTALVLAADDTSADVERARSLFEVGRDAYANGRYLVAAKAFEAADELAPRSALVFSVAQCYRLQWAVDQNPQYLERALSAYRSYLRRDPEGRRRGDAAEHIATLEQHHKTTAPPLEEPAKAKVRTELVLSAAVKGATASIDGADTVKLPVALEVEPGEHHIRVEAPGHSSLETSILALEGRVTPLMARPEPLPAQLMIRGPSGSEIYVDGRAAGRLPLTRAVTVEAGEPTVFVRKRGHEPASRQVHLELGELRALDVELEPTGQRKVAVGLMVGSTVSAVLTAGLSIGVALTHSGAQGILSRRDERPLTVEEAERYEQLRTLRNDLWVGVGIAAGLTVVLGGTGSVLYFADYARGDGGLGVSVVEGGPAVNWSVRF